MPKIKKKASNERPPNQTPSRITGYGIFKIYGIGLGSDVGGEVKSDDYEEIGLKF